MYFLKKVPILSGKSTKNPTNVQFRITVGQTLMHRDFSESNSAFAFCNFYTITSLHHTKRSGDKRLRSFSTFSMTLPGSQHDIIPALHRKRVLLHHSLQRGPGILRCPPGHAAAGGNGTRHRDQPSRKAQLTAQPLHCNGCRGGGEGSHQPQLLFPLLHAHGRIIRDAPASFSTMEYMLVTAPTASLSVRP